jgi:hypothetical protein
MLETEARDAEARINSILEKLVQSAERNSGGTAPQG